MRIFFMFSVCGLLLVACGQHKPSAKLSVTDSIPVKLIPLNSDTSSQHIRVSGLLSAENEARLSFKTGGLIESVLVRAGDRIRKGQVLATLKSTEITAQVEQVNLTFQKAQRDFDRLSRLYADSVATLEQWQNARTALALARENLKQAAFNQQYARIYAPSDGFVIKQLGNIGELAAAGTPILWVSGSSTNQPFLLKAGVSDLDWSQVEVGNKARVQFDAFPGKEFSATVSRKSLAADASSGAFMIELAVNLGREQAANGLFGKATIFPNRQEIGYRIPYEALLEADGHEGYVFVSDDRKTVQRIAVKIGAIEKDVVTISSGLEGHVYVVSAGSPYLSENSTITIR